MHIIKPKEIQYMPDNESRSVAKSAARKAATLGPLHAIWRKSSTETKMDSKWK